MNSMGSNFPERLNIIAMGHYDFSRMGLSPQHDLIHVTMHAHQALLVHTGRHYEAPKMIGVWLSTVDMDYAVYLGKFWALWAVVVSLILDLGLHWFTPTLSRVTFVVVWGLVHTLHFTMHRASILLSMLVLSFKIDQWFIYALGLSISTMTLAHVHLR